MEGSLPKTMLSKIALHSLLLFFILALPLQAQFTVRYKSQTAETKDESPKPAPDKTPDSDKKDDTGAKSTSETDPATAAETGLKEELRGLGFSAGVGAIFLSGSAPVETATTDTNNILRVSRKSKTRIGGLLEAHYLFGDPRTGKSDSSYKVEKLLERAVSLESGSLEATMQDIAWGPTVIAELGDGGLRSLGIGLMVSFRKFSVKTQKSADNIADATFTPSGNAFNLGIGYIVEPNAKSLPAGLEENKPLPTGSSISLETKSKSGIAVIFSAHF